MGIIVKQSITGTIWSYLGVGVGFITTAYLFPNYLAPDTIGLFGLLLAWSVMFAQFSSLGYGGVTARLFPYFRNPEKGHNGFLFIAFMVMITGFLLFLLVYFVFSPWLAENNAEKSRLFSEYIWLLIPLTFFTLLYTILDSYNKLLYDAVFGTFLSEFLQRVLILVVVLTFVAGLMNIHQLIIFYAVAVCAKGAVLLGYLVMKGQVDLRPPRGFVSNNLKKEMISVGFYSILTGMGGNIIFSVDKILVNQMLGLHATGIYTIAFFFGTLVIIPSRPLLRIAGTLIADAWKNDEVSYIADIYRKSCINQLILGAFLFGGIWVNIDSILIILGPEYEAGKWVIFFIGLGYMIDMATGANGHIIAYSSYYKMALWFLLVLVILVVAGMYLLVPLWGIVGAAVAIALSFLVNNFLRFLFLYRKFGLQPFTSRFLLVFSAFLPAYFAGFVLPVLPLVFDILARGSVFAIVFSAIVLAFNVSEDINKTTEAIVRKIRLILNK